MGFPIIPGRMFRDVWDDYDEFFAHGPGAMAWELARSAEFGEVTRLIVIVPNGRREPWFENLQLYPFHGPDNWAQPGRIKGLEANLLDPAQLAEFRARPTLKPSISGKLPGDWHGYIRNGNLETVEFIGGRNPPAEIFRRHRSLVRRQFLSDGKRILAYFVYCPACERAHRFITEREDDPKYVWLFDGNWDVPSFGPSLLIHAGPLRLGERDEICHSYLKNGVWWFQGDSTHALAGQHVPMVPFPDNYRV